MGRGVTYELKGLEDDLVGVLFLDGPLFLENLAIGLIDHRDRVPTLFIINQDSASFFVQ